ncbi:MAG TPA: hypothetical protein VN807_02815, partial [Candidatus Sulfotelmatobacter sp.]|nr:hypothetical protein [Candidatus Sulfotelmatobacter sp.]
MMRGLLKGALCAAVLFVTSASSAPVPLEQLAKPPANAQQYSIVSKAGTHGHSASWTLPDGTRMSRDSLNLRGQVFEVEEAARLGADGMAAAITVRGFTPSGDAAETFTIVNGRALWKSQVDAGSSAYTTPAMYIPAGGGFSPSLLIEAL